MLDLLVRGARGRAVARAVIGTVLGGVVVAGCASAPGGATSGATSSGKPATSSSRYVLFQGDLEKVRADNLYDAITKLRPDFLRGRNENGSFVAQNIPGGKGDPGSPTLPASSTGQAVGVAVPVMVYRDNVRMTGIDDLRQIQLSTVREVRYFPGPDAVVRFGTNNSGGAILVTSK